LPADGVFNFSSVYIDSGITVRFTGDAPTVSLLALEDIVVRGWIETGGRDLIVSTPGHVTIANGMAIGQGSGTGDASFPLTAGGTLGISAGLTMSTMPVQPAIGSVLQTSYVPVAYPTAVVTGRFSGVDAIRAGVAYQIDGMPLLPPGAAISAILREGSPLNAVPEPGTWLLLVTGFAALVFARQTRRSLQRFLKIPADASI
jgi:hypothetical protein